jgi:hypothetical protein
MDEKFMEETNQQIRDVFAGVHPDPEGKFGAFPVLFNYFFFIIVNVVVGVVVELTSMQLFLSLSLCDLPLLNFC